MNNGSAPDTVTGGKTLELTEYDRVWSSVTFIHFRIEKMTLSSYAFKSKKLDE